MTELLAQTRRYLVFVPLVQGYPLVGAMVVGPYTCVGFCKTWTERN